MNRPDFPPKTTFPKTEDAAPGADAAGAAAGAPIAFPPNSADVIALPNGLELIVKEDRSAPVVSLQAWCRTGSIHEGAWLGAGLSHILEHMLFKGTERRSNSAIAKAVQDEGGYINAYTSFDRTVYWIDAPKEGAAACLDILCDVMMNATMPEDEYAKEQEVIRREFAMGDDDPDRTLSKLLFATAFQEHPYGYPVIGHLDVYNRLTRADVMAYYKSRYVPNNMFFVVVGDVDAAAIRAQVEAFFKAVPRAKLEPVLIPAEPPQLGARARHLEFPTQLSKFSIAWHIPDLAHPDMPALDVLASILGDGRSARLFREIREKRGLAHSIYAYSYTPAHSGIFMIGGDCDPEKRAACEAAALELVESIKEHGVAAAEVAKAERSALSDQLGSLTTMRGQASDLGSNWLATRNLDFTREYVIALQQVTPEQVRDAACRYLIDRTRTSVSLNPKGSAGAEVALHHAPPDSPIQKFTLANGLTLLVKENPKLPLVSLRAAFRAGLLAETAETSGISRLLAASLMQGTATRSAEALADAIESAGGAMSADAGNNSLTVAAKVMSPDLRLGLDLMADVILRPAFPEEGVATERSGQIAAIKEEDERPMSVAGKALRRALFADHPYALERTGTLASLAAIGPAELRAFHGATFTAGNCVLAVFGDVKADHVLALAEELFGAMPAGERPFQSPPEAAPLVAPDAITLIKDKQQGVLLIGYRSVGVASEDRALLELLDEACSDMASRFFLRIREEMGLAYYVGASQFLGMEDGAFLFYVGTDPLKLDEVQSAMQHEIDDLAKNGLTEEEFLRAKKTYLGKHKIQRQSNGSLAHAAALDELYDLGIDHTDKLLAEIEACTLDQLNATAAKYLLGKPAVSVRVMPEAGSA
ncbi:MAG: pitrilysin family protein [Verrucomicrobiales bacterium]